MSDSSNGDDVPFGEQSDKSNLDSGTKRLRYFWFVAVARGVGI